jgi:hypothetical protein
MKSVSIILNSLIIKAVLIIASFSAFHLMERSIDFSSFFKLKFSNVSNRSYSVSASSIASILCRKVGIFSTINILSLLSKHPSFHHSRIL